MEVTWSYNNPSNVGKNFFKKYTENYSSEKDFIALFENSADLIETFNKNYNFTGGTGDYAYEEDRERVDSWVFGNDYPTHEATSTALERGEIPERYIQKLEKAKFDLQKKYPALYKLDELANLVKRRRKFNDVDGEIEIDRAMAADPNLYSLVQNSRAIKKYVRIYCEIGVSVGTSTETIISNVIFVAALCDIIERAGISVEIYFGAIACPYEDDWMEKFKSIGVLVKGKSADEPLDIQRLLSFAIPGFYRQFVFGLWDNICRPVRGTHSRCHNGFGFERYQVGTAMTLINPEIKVHCASDHLSESQIQVYIKEIYSLFNIQQETL